MNIKVQNIGKIRGSKPKSFSLKDYIKKQVSKDVINKCIGCDFYNPARLNDGTFCIVDNDDRFVCWNDDTSHSVVQNFIFIRK